MTQKKYSFEELCTPAKVRTAKSGSDGKLVYAMDYCVDTDEYLRYSPMDYFDELPPYIAPFLGYTKIAQLRQDIIYQNIITSHAEEMTAKWLELESGDDDLVSSDLVKEIQSEALETWRLDSFIREIWETYFGWDGGGLVFIDIAGHESDEQLEQELILDSAHIGKGCLRGFRVVEAINCQPDMTNAWNPLSEDYFNPKYWRILGKRIHRSRFLHFCQNKLPSLLRPLYNFFGIPWVQMLEPYRIGFERARLASLESIQNHSLLYLKTSVNELTQDPVKWKNRMDFFHACRSNSGTAIVDKDTEDFAQINTPLTDLESLVSLNFELLAMVTRQSVTKVFGTPPRGMDATGDNYKYDRAQIVEGMQRNILHDNVVRMYELIQLNKWGQVFRPITYKWRSTLELSEKEKLEAQELQSRIDATYLAETSPWGPVIHPNEIRTRLSKDKESMYAGIECDDSEGYYEAMEEYGEAETELSEGTENWPNDGSENGNPGGVQEKTPQDRSTAPKEREETPVGGWPARDS